MIASGAASSTALRTARASRRSSATGFAPSARTRSPPLTEVWVPITSRPASTNLGTRRLPIAPLAPATKTRIVFLLPSHWLGFVRLQFDGTRRRNVTGERAGLAGRAVRGQQAAATRGGVSDARLAERGRRRRPGSLASPQP